MLWTKLKYPESMKDLTVTRRNNAIEIANDLFKKKEIRWEERLIAKAIGQAKKIAAKGTKKRKAKRQLKELSAVGILIYGEIPPASAEDAHHVENTFHRREQIALYRESRKRQMTILLQKDPKCNYHYPGQG